MTRHRSPPWHWRRYSDIVLVVLGTTCGTILAHLPAVFLGDKTAKRMSMRPVHGIGTILFAVLGVLTLLDVGGHF